MSSSSHMNSFIPNSIMDEVCLSPSKGQTTSQSNNSYSPFGKSIFNGKTEQYQHTARKLDFDNVPTSHSSLFSSPNSQVAASSIQQQVRQTANSYELFNDN